MSKTAGRCGTDEGFRGKPAQRPAILP